MQSTPVQLFHDSNTGLIPNSHMTSWGWLSIKPNLSDDPPPPNGCDLTICGELPQNTGESFLSDVTTLGLTSPNWSQFCWWRRSPDDGSASSVQWFRSHVEQMGGAKKDTRRSVSVFCRCREDEIGRRSKDQQLSFDNNKIAAKNTKRGEGGWKRSTHLMWPKLTKRWPRGFFSANRWFRAPKIWLQRKKRVIKLIRTPEVHDLWPLCHGTV